MCVIKLWKLKIKFEKILGIQKRYNNTKERVYQWKKLLAAPKKSKRFQARGIPQFPATTHFFLHLPNVGYSSAHPFKVHPPISSAHVPFRHVATLCTIDRFVRTRLMYFSGQTRFIFLNGNLCKSRVGGPLRTRTHLPGSPPAESPCWCRAGPAASWARTTRTRDRARWKHCEREKKLCFWKLRVGSLDQQQRHLPYFVVCTERRWIPRARVIKHPVAPHLKENNKKKRALVKKEEEKKP